MLIRRLLFTIAAVIALGMVVAPQAQAYNFGGCKYQGSNPEIDVDVWFTTWPSAITNAADAWNAKSVPGHFDLTPGSADIELIINQWSSPEQYWAVTSGSCGGGSNVWDGNQVETLMNDGTMINLTPHQRQLVLEHEMGHAYGLDHTPDGCNATHAVMVAHEYKWACGWSGTPPWADDTNGVKARY